MGAFWEDTTPLMPDCPIQRIGKSTRWVSLKFPGVISNFDTWNQQNERTSEKNLPALLYHIRIYFFESDLGMILHLNDGSDQEQT